MDLFKFTNPGQSMLMEAGIFLPRFQSVSWVERYRDPGEITIESKPEDRIRDILPAGSFVSHPDSNEIMVIETHSIPDVPGEEPRITTYGRSLEVLLDQRVIGSNRSFPHNAVPGEVALAAGPTATQARDLINFHITSSQTVNPADSIPYLRARSSVTKPYSQARRVVTRGSLLDAITSILQVDNLGIRVIRPRGIASDTLLDIHRGVDRSSVIFSTVDGELDSAEYLWSERAYKNCALVTSRWAEVVVDDWPKTGIRRRMMFVDASDVDQGLTEQPTGGWLTLLKDSLRSRGREALAKQKAVSISQATAAPSQPGTVYGVDYAMGDIVTVAGAYANPKQMRVTEYVRIQDAEGEQGYPSFEEVEEDQ